MLACVNFIFHFSVCCASPPPFFTCPVTPRFFLPHSRNCGYSTRGPFFSLGSHTR